MRVELPRGQWAEINDPEDITGEQKKTYQRAVDKIMYPDGAQVTYVPDPDNPAVMIPVEPTRARLATPDILALREMVHAWCITSWSYEWPVSAESFDKIPAMATDKIEEALTENGCYDVFNSAGPKETKATEPTSSDTSPGAAPAPLPE